MGTQPVPDADRTIADLRAEVARLTQINLALADRCHAQSELLAKRVDLPRDEAAMARMMEWAKWEPGRQAAPEAVSADTRVKFIWSAPEGEYPPNVVVLSAELAEMIKRHGPPKYIETPTPAAKESV